MADHDQEKTEYLSQKKLEQSREKGELPHSRELSTFIVFAVVLTYFALTRQAWFDGMGAIVADLLAFDAHWRALGPDTLDEFLLMPVVRAVVLVAPLFLVILIVSPLLTMTQTGFNIARDRLAPDWSRIDPVAGLRRLISRRQWIEGAKACVKLGVFVWLVASAIEGRMPRIKLIAAMDVRGQIALLVDLGLAIGVRIALAMAILAALDVGYQWWEFLRRLRLTPQELKEEIKEREGNPLIRQRQRSLQMQRARARMMKEVPRASVVITNPTHYAVALRYDRTKAPAPYVVAKGADLIAARIREIAQAHGVPIVEHKALARALWRQARVGRMIPNEFFKAVAEVLAFVHWLRLGKRARLAAGRLVSPPARAGRAPSHSVVTRAAGPS